MQVCGDLPGRSASEDAPSLGTVRGKARAGRHWQDRFEDKQPERGQYTTSGAAAGYSGILFFVFFIFFVVVSLIVVIIFFLVFLIFFLVFLIFLLVFLLSFLVSLFVFTLCGGRPDSSGSVLLPCVFPAPAPGGIPRKRVGGHLLPGLR